MKVTKLGHCCLIIETKSLRILTDPGSYSTQQNEVTRIDLILITHEHSDHFHLESLKAVLEHNPEAEIITNKGVGALLDKEGIEYMLIEDGEKETIRDTLIEGLGTTHAEIYKTWGSVENTGYFIDNKLFYPGDAFYDPKRPIDILALPVAGPWMKISEAVDYALALKPRTAFPVHDGGVKNAGVAHRVPMFVLPEAGILFQALEENKEYEF